MCTRSPGLSSPLKTKQPFPAAALYEKAVKKAKSFLLPTATETLLHLPTYSRFPMFGRLLRSIGQYF